MKRKIANARQAAEAVRNDIEALRRVPPELFDGAVYDACMEWQDELGAELDGVSPDLLGFVPEKYRTEEICTMFVEFNGRCLKDVPEKLKTYDMCLFAVRENLSDNADDRTLPIQFVPEGVMDEDLVLEACEANGFSLAHVPERLKTPAVCLEAVRECGEAIEFVPPALRGRELCMGALEHSQFDEQKVLEHVPPEIRRECGQNAKGPSPA